MKTISGISWALLSHGFTLIVHFIVSVILARMLTPADFGLIGMVTVFTGFAQIMSLTGFGQALIQRLEVDDRHYYSVFWLNLGIGASITLFLWLSAPLIASLYHEPRLIHVIRIVSLVFLIGAFNIVQRTILQRDMNFRRMGMIRVFSVILAGSVAVAMAFMKFGVWSLAALMLVDTAGEVTLMWGSSKWRPRFSFQWSAVKDLLGFALSFSGFTIVDYWSRNVDNMLIGRFMGSATLGIYMRAYALMLLPMNLLFMVVNQVMNPAMAIIQKNIPQVQRVYLKSVASFALVSIPMMLGLFTVADSFIQSLYGPKWLDVIPVLRYLCFVGLLRSITVTSKWVFQSQNRVDILFRWELIKSIMTICGFVYGILSRDINVFVKIFLAIVVVLFPIELYLPLRVIHLSIPMMLRNLSGIVFCALLMVASVYALDTLLTGAWSSWPRLIANSLAGLFTYILSLHLFKIEIYIEWLGIGQQQWYRLIGKRLQNLT